METEKLAEIFSIRNNTLPQNKTIMNSIKFIIKLIRIDKTNKFAESLSLRGKTIASSYLKEDAIIIIPTNER